MQYSNIIKGKFLSRPNRFVAHVELGGEVCVCHVKNTGRCKELLVPGHTVWLQESDNPARKTKYDLIAVDRAGLLVNMDAQAPNKVFAEWVRAGGMGEMAEVRPESKYKNSRFDFKLTRPDGRVCYAEIKGCTLEQEGVARFPDAPTERGVKHILELIEARQEGHDAAICFVLQMKGVDHFEPNWATHRAFGEALVQAKAAGVEILAYDCIVTPDSLQMDKPVPVVLDLK